MATAKGGFFVLPSCAIYAGVCLDGSGPRGLRRSRRATHAPGTATIAGTVTRNTGGIAYPTGRDRRPKPVPVTRQATCDYRYPRITALSTGSDRVDTKSPRKFASLTIREPLATASTYAVCPTGPSVVSTTSPARGSSGYASTYFGAPQTKARSGRRYFTYDTQLDASYEVTTGTSSSGNAIISNGLTYPCSKYGPKSSLTDAIVSCASAVGLGASAATT